MGWQIIVCIELSSSLSPDRVVKYLLKLMSLSMFSMLKLSLFSNVERRCQRNKVGRLVLGIIIFHFAKLFKQITQFPKHYLKSKNKYICSYLKTKFSLSSLTSTLTRVYNNSSSTPIRSYCSVFSPSSLLCFKESPSFLFSLTCSILPGL